MRPGAGDLVVRFGIYLVLGALVLALGTGRNAVRWTVPVLVLMFRPAATAFFRRSH